MTGNPASMEEPPWFLRSLRSVSAVAAILIAAKILGFAEKQVLAWSFGATATADAYFVTIATVNTMFFFFKELVDPVLLPLFVAKSNSDRQASAIGSLQVSTVAIVGGALGCVAALVFWPEKVASWLAPGLSAEDLKKTSLMLRVGVLAVPILGFSVITQTILNGSRRFAFAALGDLGQKVGLLLSVGAAKLAPSPFLALGFAPVVGAVLKVATHLPTTGAWLKRSFSKWHGLAPERRELRRLTAPLLAAAIFSQSRELFENHFTSTVGVGAIAAHVYARRLAEMPLLLASHTLSTVSFPHMSRLASEGKHRELVRVTGTCSRALALLFMPLGVATFLLSEQIVALVFARGAFDHAAVQGSASALRVYGLGFWVLAIEPIVIQAFYSQSNTRTPTIAGIASALVEITLMAVLVPSYQIAAIAGALVVSKTCKVFVLGSLLALSEKDHRTIELVRAGVPFVLSFFVCLAAGSFLVEEFSWAGRGGQSAGVCRWRLLVEVIGFGSVLFVAFLSSYLLLTGRVTRSRVLEWLRRQPK